MNVDVNVEQNINTPFTSSNQTTPYEEMERQNLNIFPNEETPNVNTPFTPSNHTTPYGEIKRQNVNIFPNEETATQNLNFRINTMLDVIIEHDEIDELIKKKIIEEEYDTEALIDDYIDNEASMIQPANIISGLQTYYIYKMYKKK